MLQFGSGAFARLLVVSALFFSFALAGCGPDTSPKEITETRIVRAPANAAEEKPATGGRLAWNTPDGWQKGRDRNMRLVTFHPDGNQGVDCYITVLGGAAGGVQANLNRWCDQMGSGPLSAAEIAALPSIDVLGRACRVLGLKGTFSGKPDHALYGVVCPLPDRLLTIKMIGPAKLLETERENFEKFCKSLHQS